jgi:hypothetical protein
MHLKTSIIHNMINVYEHVMNHGRFKCIKCMWLFILLNTSRSFPCSWLITGFVTRLTRRVSLVEQELPTLPQHLSSPPVFSGVRVTRSLVLYVCFVDRCLSFCTFLLAIVLSVLLRYTDSDYPFGIFKLFLSLLKNWWLKLRILNIDDIFFIRFIILFSLFG